MARAWILTDRRGGLLIRARATIDGKPYSRDKSIPNADRELAEETERELNRRFALGDYTWLTENRRRAPRRRSKVPAFAAFADAWVKGLEGQVEDSTRASYRSAVKAWKAALGGRRIDQVGTADLITAQRDWIKAGRRERTIGDRMNILAQLYRDARLSGIVTETPFDKPLPKRRTKRARRERSTKRTTFQPFTAEELGKLLEVIRDPKNSGERRDFPLTEYLLLSGQRFGEGAAVRFDDINRGTRTLSMRRARAPRGPVKIDDPTKTGSEWRISLRPALFSLLGRQREAHFMAGHGWVFPTSRGTPLLCSNWRRRGWETILERAEVDARPGEAQKALRRTYICSALVCSRNPKLVAAELGHSTARMVMDNYDAWLDPAQWPDAEERAALAAIYEWPDVTITVPETREAAG